MATLINQSFFTFGDITGGGEPFDYFVLRSDGEWSPCVCGNVRDAPGGVNWSSDSNTGFYQVSDMAIAGNLHYTMNVNSKTGSLVAVSVT